MNKVLNDIELTSPPFWEKPLEELSNQEWELLCDGCGRCCHEKFEDEESGEIIYSNIACQLFDADRCQCKDYPHRRQYVADCLSIREIDRSLYHWLPEQCAYRLRAGNYPLPEWHPLRSGDSESVHQAGISMRESSINAELYPLI